MNGRRIFPDDNGWLTQKFEPGDYGMANPTAMENGSPLADWIKALYPQWLGMSPNGHLGSFASHQVTEHEDGTITVSPSILISDGKGQQLYHGYLERGAWREC